LTFLFHDLEWGRKEIKIMSELELNAGAEWHGNEPTATKLFPSGAIEVCDIINNQLIRKTFYGYTKQEAIASFKAEHRKE
jgi:hypothetical protein